VYIHYSNVFSIAKSKLNHLIINGSEDGISLASVEAECNGVSVYGSRQGITMFNSTVNISDCTFSWTDAFAFRLAGSNMVALSHCLVEGGEYGIYSDSIHHWLSITDCTFRNITASAIRLIDRYVHTVMPATLRLHRNLFSGSTRAVHVDQNVGDDILVDVTNNVIESASMNARNEDSGISTSGVYINLEAVGSQAHVKLQGNTFQSLPYSAVSISRCHGSLLLGNHSTTIIGNNFTDTSHTAVVIACANTSSMLIQSNTFLENTMTIGPSCLDISSGEGGNGSVTELRIDRNEFRENSGTYVVRIVAPVWSTLLASGDIAGSSEFVSNTLVDNFPLDSTVYSENSYLRMHFNTFSNQRARFELRIGFPPDQVANCTFNWWGTSSEDGVAMRIFDHMDMASLGSVEYLPFLNSSTSQFSCAALSDCSGHGSCIYSDTCLCGDGWSGSDCSRYSCADIYECSGRGQCVGPNLCQCDNGWLPDDCSRASCILRNNCSNRGVCSLPNV